MNFQYMVSMYTWNHVSWRKMRVMTRLTVFKLKLNLNEEQTIQFTLNILKGPIIKLEKYWFPFQEKILILGTIKLYFKRPKF